MLARQLNTDTSLNISAECQKNAWYGWAGIKIISEVTMRTRKPDQLMQDLKENIKFDGPKGRKVIFPT